MLPDETEVYGTTDMFLAVFFLYHKVKIKEARRIRGEQCEFVFHWDERLPEIEQEFANSLMDTSLGKVNCHEWERCLKMIKTMIYSGRPEKRQSSTEFKRRD